MAKSNTGESAIGMSSNPTIETSSGTAGGSARVAVCDLSDPGGVNALAGALSDEPVSILINKAGIAGPVRPFVDVEPDNWDEVSAASVRSINRSRFRNLVP